jgi:hypothetical protein
MTKPGGFGRPVLRICNLFVIWDFGNEIAAYLSGAGKARLEAALGYPEPVGSLDIAWSRGYTSWHVFKPAVPAAEGG